MKWLDPNNPFDNSYYGEKRPSTWKIILFGLGLFIIFLLMFEGLARILFCSATLIFTAITVWLEHHQKRAANMLEDEFKTLLMSNWQTKCVNVHPRLSSFSTLESLLWRLFSLPRSSF